jgi:hypothetical protein
MENHKVVSKQPEEQVISNLHFLDTSQVEMIDQALVGLGKYGEVRLIVDGGRLRFVVSQKNSKLA